MSLSFSFLREIGRKWKWIREKKYTTGWIYCATLSLQKDIKRPNCAAASALPQSWSRSLLVALQPNALSPYSRLRHEITGRQANRRWAKSQEVVVVQKLRVLTAFPQAEEAEVKVHLDHLFACRNKTTQRKQDMTKLQNYLENLTSSSITPDNPGTLYH